MGIISLLQGFFCSHIWGINKLSGLFSSPKQPEIPKITTLNPDEAAKEAIAKEAAKARKRKGRLSTILTGMNSDGTLKNTFG